MGELEELRAHVDRLTAILDSVTPCNDDCGLAAVLAWVDPADRQRVAKLRDVRDQRAIVDALRDLYDEDHLQCERRNADEPCDVCVPCVARMKYQRAWDAVGRSKSAG